MTGSEPEVLTLAEPAGTLWKETETAVRRALDDLPDGPHEWRIGGGTILAARWGHRKSFDIDLTIGPRANLRHLLSPAGREIETLARRLGGAITDHRAVAGRRQRRDLDLGRTLVGSSNVQQVICD